jgi:NAD(P)-dependent dehydrogenase (short-subunit alcohol dehydrogenase family)
MAEAMLKGKVAVVTGSGRGIGRAIAMMMASRGASVVVNDVGAGLHDQNIDATPAEETVNDIRKAGGQAVAAIDSVAEWDGAQRIVKTAIDSFGRIDILVNNAGILRERMFHRMEKADIDAVVRVHLYGAFNMSRAAVEHFRRQESGCFLHMTSRAGLFGAVGQANYSAAKMAIIGLSNALQLEMKRYGVRSNIISPSANTRMTQSTPVRTTPEENAARLAAMPPEGVAVLATMLASDAARHVQGQIIGARGSEIILYNHPRPVRFLHRDGGWTPETLSEAIMALAPFTPMGRGSDAMKWNPV